MFQLKTLEIFRDGGREERCSGNCKQEHKELSGLIVQGMWETKSPTLVISTENLKEKWISIKARR